MLYIYNSFSRKKEVFKPLDENHIRLYLCGPTVYDRIHLGNCRPFVVFDSFFRLLKHVYPKVTFVRNITDVDDKIIARAHERNISIDALTKETTDFYHEDLKALNILPPTVEPKATEHIDEMITMIEKLINRGHAYAADDHVLFNVASMTDYGQLSKLDQDAILAGARVEVASYKKNAADFVLWKPAKQGEPAWDSPWGKGRPGWHIECSAMSEKYLGPRFDIHCGGNDLTFPHHENELAQSCCAHGFSAKEGFAQYWMHNGMLNIKGEKMSKSLGNFFTAAEILAKYQGEVLRLMLLSSHYRKPLDGSMDNLDQAKENMDRFYTALRQNAHIQADIAYNTAFLNALKDDMNTPEALSLMHEITTKLNKAENHEQKAQYKGELLGCGHILGLLQQSAETWFKWQPQSQENKVSDEEIEKLIAERNQAKADKNWALADEIRDKLSALNITLEDGPEGTIWRYR